jgi:hypothetical protein
MQLQGNYAGNCPYPAITLPQPKSPDWAENITYGIPGDEVTTRCGSGRIEYSSANRRIS